MPNPGPTSSPFASALQLLRLSSLSALAPWWSLKIGLKNYQYVFFLEIGGTPQLLQPRQF